jgi:signal transduction histidine kinase
MSARTDAVRSVARFPALLLGIAGVYLGAARLGLALAFVAEQTTTVWPPSGIALAAVLLLGARVWPAIWLGAFLANVMASAPLLTAVAIAGGNTLEALAGRWLLRRVAGPDFTPDRVKPVVGLVVLAALGSTTVSATIGTLSLILGGVQPSTSLGAIWWAWWVGDATGILVVTPLLLAWFAGPWRPSAFRLAEGLGLLALLVLTMVTGFIGPLARLSGQHPLEYTVFLFVIWGALRFGQRGTATVTAVASAVALWGTLQGSGPFATGDPHESLLALQLFMGTVAGSGLLLGAAVTERKSVEEALQRVHAELQEASRTKDEFLATLGHELRNPLGAITSAVAGLRAAATGDRAATLCSIIERQTGQLTRLVDDLLDVARIATGKISLEREPLDLHAAVEQCLTGLGQAGRTAQHRLFFDGSPALIDADRVRLEQVVSNLLDNALKYTPPGGAIHVTVRPEADEVVLRVRDTGIGIPASFLPRIFDLFAQAPPRRPEGSRSGLGLGLTVVRRLVELHDGRVMAHSDGPGTGTEVIVRLPSAGMSGEAGRPP